MGEAGDFKSLRDPPVQAPRPGLFSWPTHAPTKNDGHPRQTPRARFALEERWTGCQVLVVVILLLVVRRHPTGIHGIFQLTKDTHREDLHPLLLVGAEALVERLPRIDELFESGGSLSKASARPRNSSIGSTARC